LSFLKSKLRNNLEEHVEVVIGMYSQRIFTLENFLYQTVFDEWFVSGGAWEIYGKHLRCSLEYAEQY